VLARVVAKELFRAVDTVIISASLIGIALNVISSFIGIASACRQTMRRQRNTGSGKDSGTHIDTSPRKIDTGILQVGNQH
jgi:hypothetical protein